MNKSYYTKAVWTSILILVMLIVPMSLEACPGCKNLNDPINKGFNWSILFMMAMPFTVFGLVGGTIFLHFNGYRLSAIGYRLRAICGIKGYGNRHKKLPTTDNRQLIKNKGVKL